MLVVNPGRYAPLPLMRSIKISSPTCYSWSLRPNGICHMILYSVNGIAVIYKRNHSRLQVKAHGQFKSKGIPIPIFLFWLFLDTLNQRFPTSVRHIAQKNTSQPYDEPSGDCNDGPLRPLPSLQLHIPHSHPTVPCDQNPTALDQS